MKLVFAARRIQIDRHGWSRGRYYGVGLPLFFVRLIGHDAPGPLPKVSFYVRCNGRAELPDAIRRHGIEGDIVVHREAG